MAVSNELTVAGGKIARFAQIVEHNAHLAALTFDRKVREAIWKAGDPEGWRQCGLDESRRMDEAVIFNSFEAIRQAFQTLTWPDWDELLAEIQREAAMAAERRRSQQNDAMAKAKLVSSRVPFENVSDEVWEGVAWFLGANVPRPEMHVVRAAVACGLVYGEAISFAIKHDAGGGKGCIFITHYGHAAISWRMSQNERQNGHPQGTIFFLGNRSYRVGEGEPISVPERDNCVLQAFIDRPALDSAGVAERSGYDVTKVSKIISGLRSKYPMFADAITVPGAKGKGGYRAVVVDLTKPKQE